MSESITLTTAQNWLRTIAAEAPDRVAECQYVRADADGKFNPDCIIGVMLVRYLHLDPEYLSQFGSIFSASYEGMLPYTNIDGDALFYMCLAQALQDGQTCDQQNWQSAVSKADAAMKVIDVTGGGYNVNLVGQISRPLGYIV